MEYFDEFIEFIEFFNEDLMDYILYKKKLGGFI